MAMFSPQPNCKPNFGDVELGHHKAFLGQAGRGKKNGFRKQLKAFEPVPWGQALPKALQFLLEQKATDVGLNS